MNATLKPNVVLGLYGFVVSLGWLFAHTPGAVAGVAGASFLLMAIETFVGR